jgi:hypothetical protein
MVVHIESEFCEGRQLLCDTDFNQADQTSTGGICDALSLYWLKRCVKMNGQETGRYPTAASFAFKAKHFETLTQATLRERIVEKFDKIEQMRLKLSQERDRMMGIAETRNKAMMRTQQALQAGDRELFPRVGKPGPKLSDLARAQEKGLSDALDQHDEAGLARHYGFSLEKEAEGDMSPGSGQSMLAFVLENDLVTISIFPQPRGQPGHAMAAYRARAFVQWGFVFFDPNRGMYLCNTEDGAQFLSEWCNGYRNVDGSKWVHDWKLEAWEVIDPR